MCLSTAYEVTGGNEKKIAEYISTVKVSDGSVYLTDIMGIETVVPGHISSVDLVKNAILIEQ